MENAEKNSGNRLRTYKHPDTYMKTKAGLHLPDEQPSRHWDIDRKREIQLLEHTGG